MKRRKRREWTQEELEFIKANWEGLQLTEIARRLDRPISSVAKKPERSDCGKTAHGRSAKRLSCGRITARGPHAS